MARAYAETAGDMEAVRWGNEERDPVGLERAYLDLAAAVARLDSSLKGLEHQLSPVTVTGPGRADSPTEERKPSSVATEAIAAQARRIESLFLDVEELRSRLEV